MGLDGRQWESGVTAWKILDFSRFVKFFHKPEGNVNNHLRGGLNTAAQRSPAGRGE
jgi:hypothetical protein